MLDFGCGGGWAARTLSEEGFAVTALDPVQEMLELLADCADIETISGDIFSLNRLWDRQLAEGRVYGVVHPGGWCDVGRPESIVLAEMMLERADG